ncbi:MAG: microbial collagenase [Thermoleophilaceae bacterium]|nr:microbial collagenase [Thermoleophilaceae bacterium]
MIGLSGIDVNPLHIGVAQAQSASGDFPPDTSGGDCDNDNDAGTDIGELGECLLFNGKSWLSDNQDLIFYSLAGLAVGVLVIGVGLFLAPEIFASAGLIAAYGTLATVGPGTAAAYSFVIFSSDFYVLSTAISALGAAGLGYFGSMAETSPIAPRVRAAASASDIALPAPVAVRVPSVRKITKACGRVKRRALCRRVALAGRAYALALARTISVSGAMAVTVKRLRNAGTDPGRQTATSKVLALRLLDALTAQQAAGRAYAKELRGAHIDLRLSAAQTRRALTALRNLKHVPAALIQQLQDNLELSRPDLTKLIRRTLTRTVGRPRRFDFVKELERPVPTAGLQAAYESMRIQEVGRLLNELNYEKRISAPDTLGLVNDLLAAQRACSPQQRRGPMGQFTADVRAHVQGPYAQFLQDAAVPLLGEHPYPNNLPPVAAFTGPERSGPASPDRPLHAIFRENSNDDQDGGAVGCWEWNFGDPSSGADNVSFLPNPTHDYTQPGQYTVTLKVIDDDGFASATTTGTVTGTTP